MKLTFPILNTTIHVPVDDTSYSGKKSRRSILRKKSEERVVETTEKIEPVEAKPKVDTKTPEKVLESEEGKPIVSTDAPESNSQPLLMVEVVNVVHEKFRQTEEIKVIVIFSLISLTS